MVEARTSPPIWRLVLAFLIAPAAAAFIYACLVPLYAGLPDLADRIWRTFVAYLVFGAFPATLVLGVPAYFTLKSRLSPTPLNCALVGAGVAVIPWLLMGLIAPPNRSDDYLPRLLDFGVLVAQFACLGFLAGLIFWAVAAFRFGRTG